MFDPNGITTDRTNEAAGHTESSRLNVQKPKINLSESESDSFAKNIESSSGNQEKDESSSSFSFKFEEKIMIYEIEQHRKKV